jgi:hypothetical protein
MRAAVFAVLLALSAGHAAQAALLRCTPEPGRLQVHVHGFGRGDRLPEGLETFSALVHAGADHYELDPEEMLRVEARRDLSAGAAAELAFEGTAAANGTEFLARVTFRAEGRVMQGLVRCKLL